MRISRRNLSLLVESLLTEGMFYDEIEKGAAKKILKMYRSFIWKCFHDSYKAEGTLGYFIPSPIDALDAFFKKQHGFDIKDDMKAAYARPIVQEALEEIELIFLRNIKSILDDSRLVPYDLIGRGEDERIRSVNRGKVLSWCLQRAKKDIANNTAESLFDDFADCPLNNWKNLKIITSPITLRIFMVLDEIGETILKANRYKKELPVKISYPRLLRRMDDWPNDVELFFQYRHLLPNDRQEISDYRSHVEINQVINSIRDAITAEKEEEELKATLTHRQETSKEAKKGLLFYRGGLYAADNEPYLKTRNPNTGYYTNPDSEGIVVANELNREAAKLVGSDRPEPKREGENWPGREPCDWCTAGNTDHDYYAQYKTDGDLFYVEIQGKRYQIHFATGQYMNVTDNPIYGEEYVKVLTVLFNELAKEFGGFDEMDTRGVYTTARKIRDKYRGSAGALDACGLLGAPQY